MPGIQEIKNLEELFVSAQPPRFTYGDRFGDILFNMAEEAYRKYLQAPHKKSINDRIYEEVTKGNNPNLYTKAAGEASHVSKSDFMGWNSRNSNNAKIKKVGEKYWFQTYSPVFGNPNPSDVTQRIYINCAADDIGTIAHQFSKACQKAGIPYTFKFKAGEIVPRAEQMVFYSNEKYMLQHVKILDKIIKDNPGIVARMGDPPIFSGKLGAIGIASEPLVRTKSAHSFNMKVSDSIFEAYWKLKKENISDVQARNEKMYGYFTQNMDNLGYSERFIRKTNIAPEIKSNLKGFRELM